MNGIFYFSSTGNSLYIAQELKKRIGGQMRYIPKYDGSGEEFDKLYIVSPVYSFGLPKHVYELMPKLDKTKELVVILNYGGMAGGADYFCYKYAAELGLNIKSVFILKMPENFTVTFTVPKFYLKGVLKKSYKRINKVLTDVESGKHSLPKKRKTHEETYLKNKSNWHLIGKRFSVTDKCVRCGKCVSLCPADNIELIDGKIEFDDKCVACLGCYHRCPQKAIVYLNKRKKDRYVNPNINESDIGTDFAETESE